MIDKNGRFPHSYVEIDSLRPFPIGNKDSFKYLGTINDEDYQNIIHRVTHSTIQFDGYRDHRGIVPESDELKIKDYKPTDHDKSCNQLIVFFNCLN